MKRSSESLVVQIQSQGKDYIKVEDKNDAVSALKPAPWPMWYHPQWQKTQPDGEQNHLHCGISNNYIRPGLTFAHQNIGFVDFVKQNIDRQKGAELLI